MTRFRPFRNDDPPDLVDLWNRGLPDNGVTRPLDAHEFDGVIMGKLQFDRRGLIVAERDDRMVGFVHAGFGPAQPEGPSHALDYSLGTIGMLVVDPGCDDPEIERGLVLEAEGYLRSCGAKVLYAGGQYPLNPFYWGIYGGSEWSGVLGSHVSFHRALQAAGYQEVSRSVLFEIDLVRQEIRDPKAAILRRQARLETFEDSNPANWWDALALNFFRPTAYRLASKIDGRLLAHAASWDMNGFGRRDGRPRIGLIDMEVIPEYRRQGFGRHLVAEIIRQARVQLIEIACLQTAATNAAAIALYQSIGFVEVETSALYRLPAELGDRSRTGG